MEHQEMTYLLLCLKIQSGEYEFDSKSLHALEGSLTRAEKDAFGDDYASGFYDDEEVEKDGDAYYFNGGEVAVTPKWYKEISESEYALLKGLLY
jgi:hypothetical protein